MASSRLSTEDNHDIQGFVLFAYRKLPYARYLHLAFEGDAKAWLREIADEIHTGRRDAEEDGCRTHVAFTARGLEKIGLSRDDLAQFSREFQQGMANPARAHVNGDEPENWEFGNADKPVDVLLLLYGVTHEGVEHLRTRTAKIAESHGGTVVHEDIAARLGEREHFGFRDGISQPHIAGSPHPTGPECDDLDPGEFLLGHQNGYGDTPTVLTAKEKFPIGLNGTFLVYRKLAQDVPAFWKYMREHGEGDPKKLASRFVGRWPNGAPLVKYPDKEPAERATAKESFAFRHEDPDGSKCPLGAHIRRVNPRDMLQGNEEESLRVSSRHRLVRRGRFYGKAPHGTSELAMNDASTEDRGLIFIALNASIRRQFEFVQQTWVNNQKFGGLYDERDPLVGTASGDQPFTLQQAPLRKRLNIAQRFVTMRGGGYFFVPSKSVVKWLATK